jgi:cytochrome c biogenesis protein CcmG, thiol:disulfide interchange protein DsbE
MWKYLLPIIAFVVMIPIFIVGMNRNVSELPSPLLEKQAPQFELPALHDPNDVVGSKTYEGQVALVNADIRPELA